MTYAEQTATTEQRARSSAGRKCLIRPSGKESTNAIRSPSQFITGTGIALAPTPKTPHTT